MVGGGGPGDVEKVALDVLGCGGAVTDGHAEDVCEVEVEVCADGPGEGGRVGKVGCVGGKGRGEYAYSVLGVFENILWGV